MIWVLFSSLGCIIFPGQIPRYESPFWEIEENDTAFQVATNDTSIVDSADTQDTAIQHDSVNQLADSASQLANSAIQLADSAVQPDST